MQLILVYPQALVRSHSKADHLAKALTNSLRKLDCHTFVGHQQAGQLQLSFALPQHHEGEIRGRLTIDANSGYLSISLEVRGKPHLEQLNVCNLTRLCRAAQTASDLYSLKVHPTDGSISIFFGTVVPIYETSPYEVQELVEEHLQSLQKNLFVRLQKIKCLTNYSKSEFHIHGSIDNRREGLPLRKSLDKLKKYVMTSTKYAWKSIMPKDNPYEDKTTMKRNFRDHFSKDVPVQRNMCLEALNVGMAPVIEKFFMMGKGDDDEAYDQYLVKELSIAEEDTLVRRLQLLPKELAELLQAKTLEHNGMVLHLRRVPTKEADRELQAINQLPQQRYPTLPMYYQIDSLPVEEDFTYIVTGSPKGCLYTDFLKRNSQVLSMHSLLLMLNDIARTLLHLRDHDIISNSLVPYEVLVLSNLQLHLNCLENAYHSTMQNRIIKSKVVQVTRDRHEDPNCMEEQEKEPVCVQEVELSPCRNILPYVSHTHLGHFYSHSSELSDVYSFGLIMFRTLLGRNLFDIRRNTLDQLREFDIIKLMSERQPVFALERLHRFGMDHMKLLTNFALMASCHHAPGLLDPQHQPTESVNSMLTSCRPYLDWVVVVVESATQFFQQQYRL